LFTDDDVVVEPGWADAMVARFEDPGVGAVGGRILPQWLEPMPTWLDGPHAVVVTLHDWGTEERDFGPNELPIGANMAVRRSALPPGPPFDPRLGHRPGAPMGGDENALMYRLRSGWRLRYAPAALARHRVGPDRVRWAALTRQFFYFGVGEARLLRCAEGPGDLPNLAHRVDAFRRGVVGAREGRRWREDPPNPIEAQRRLDRFFRLGHGAELVLGRWTKLADAAEAVLAAHMLPSQR
jgi:hypothetical protein